MKIFGREMQGHAKTLVILLAVLLVSSGLCGLQIVISNRGSGGDRLTGIFIPLGLVELLAMLVSAAGIVFVSILWGARALRGGVGKPPKDEVQKLFNHTDETKHNDER
jgi:hypothetical protein